MPDKTLKLEQQLGFNYERGISRIALCTIDEEAPLKHLINGINEIINDYSTLKTRMKIRELREDKVFIKRVKLLFSQNGPRLWPSANEPTPPWLIVPEMETDPEKRGNYPYSLHFSVPDEREILLETFMDLVLVKVATRFSNTRRSGIQHPCAGGELADTGEVDLSSLDIIHTKARNADMRTSEFTLPNSQEVASSCHSEAGSGQYTSVLPQEPAQLSPGSRLSSSVDQIPAYECSTDKRTHMQTPLAGEAGPLSCSSDQSLRASRTKLPVRRAGNPPDTLKRNNPDDTEDDTDEPSKKRLGKLPAPEHCVTSTKAHSAWRKGPVKSAPSSAKPPGVQPLNTLREAQLRDLTNLTMRQNGQPRDSAFKRPPNDKPSREHMEMPHGENVFFVQGADELRPAKLIRRSFANDPPLTRSKQTRAPDVSPSEDGVSVSSREPSAEVIGHSERSGSESLYAASQDFNDTVRLAMLAQSPFRNVSRAIATLQIYFDERSSTASNLFLPYASPRAIDELCDIFTMIDEEVPARLRYPNQFISVLRIERSHQEKVYWLQRNKSTLQSELGELMKDVGLGSLNRRDKELEDLHVDVLWSSRGKRL